MENRQNLWHLDSITQEEVLGMEFLDRISNCWSCLDPCWPYTGIGTNQTVSPLTDKTRCHWGQPSLMLEDLQRAGTCITSKTFNLGMSSCSDTCCSTLWVNSSGQQQCFQSPDTTWWAFTSVESNKPQDLSTTDSMIEAPFRP